MAGATDKIDAAIEAVLNRHVFSLLHIIVGFTLFCSTFKTPEKMVQLCISVDLSDITLRQIRWSLVIG